MTDAQEYLKCIRAIAAAPDGLTPAQLREQFGPGWRYHLRKALHLKLVRQVGTAPDHSFAAAMTIEVDVFPDPTDRAVVFVEPEPPDGDG